MKDHTPSNRRLAARLGISLPKEADVQSSEAAWSSCGENTLFEGKGAGACRLDFVQGTWELTLLRSNRTVGSYGTLDSALRMARYLQSKTARKAFYGSRPKVEKANQHLLPENSESLRDFLQSVNGGAVTVR